MASDVRFFLGLAGGLLASKPPSGSRPDLACVGASSSAGGAVLKRREAGHAVSVASAKRLSGSGGGEAGTAWARQARTFLLETLHSAAVSSAKKGSAEGSLGVVELCNGADVGADATG